MGIVLAKEGIVLAKEADLPVEGDRGRRIFLLKARKGAMCPSMDANRIGGIGVPG